MLRLDELRVDLLDGVFEDRFRLALVEDGEVALQPDLFTVYPEDALGDAVEGAAPELASGDSGQVLDPLEHFSGRFVRKGEKEDLPRLDALVQKIGHPVGEGASLSRARPGKDKVRTRLRRHGGVLLVVQLGAEVDGRKFEMHPSTAVRSARMRKRKSH